MSERMKIPTPAGHVIDVEAPVIAAYAVNHKGTIRWWVWCCECRDWHTHGPGEGHREAHCSGETRYTRTGYNLALAGTMSWRQAKLERERKLSGEFDGPPRD